MPKKSQINEYSDSIGVRVAGVFDPLVPEPNGGDASAGGQQILVCE